MKKGLEKDLSDSVFLRNLFDAYGTSKFIPEETSIPSLTDRNFRSKEKFDYIAPSKRYRDCRLNRMLLRGIRKFPTGQNEYFALSFSKQGNSISSIFLGNNGVGKSSLYSAIERIGAGYMSSAAFRGYTDPEMQHNYLRHAGASNDESVIRMESNSEIFTYKIGKDFSPVAFPAFFCMESDVVSLSNALDAKYISKQLNLFDYYQLMDCFEKLLRKRNELLDSYKSEKRNYDRLMFEKIVIEKINASTLVKLNEFRSVLELDDQLSDPSLEIQKKNNLLYDSLKKTFLLIGPDYSDHDFYIVLKNLYGLDVNEIVNQPYEGWRQKGSNRVNFPDSFEENAWLTQIYINIKKLILQFIRPVDKNEYNYERIEKELERNKEQMNFSLSKIHKSEDEAILLKIDDDSFKDFMRVRNYLLGRYSKIMDDVLYYAEIAFKYLMKPYYNNDIRKFIFEKTNQGLNISISIQGIVPKTKKIIDFPIDPRNYLNTFRFKIYCVAVKVSLAFTCMRLYNLNFPLVIDDVFDSSDFCNREKIQSFISHLFDCHAFLRFRDNLQLIFFTQDDVIADSVYRGINDSVGDENVKFSRIFNYYEATKADITKELIGDEDSSVISIEQPLSYFI